MGASSGGGLSLVFQYFFAVGSGIGAGLVATIGGALLIYNKVKGANIKWLGNKKRR